jgi:hypothetical protein
MNRADRRRRTGWLHRLASARSQGAVEGGKVYTSAIAQRLVRHLSQARDGTT